MSRRCRQQELTTFISGPRSFIKEPGKLTHAADDCERERERRPEAEFLMFGFEGRLEHVFFYYVMLKPPEVIDSLPEGIGANFYLAGGEIDGPNLHGKIREALPKGVTPRRRA